MACKSPSPQRGTLVASPQEMLDIERQALRLDALLITGSKRDARREVQKQGSGTQGPGYPEDWRSKKEASNETPETTRLDSHRRPGGVFGVVAVAATKHQANDGPHRSAEKVIILKQNKAVPTPSVGACVSICFVFSYFTNLDVDVARSVDMMGLQVAADIWTIVMETFNDENRAGVE
ncbi:hypothetical protein E5D57_009076 [Metarhizium anisopliae]|nr:hypothetical protein E5D57_009076 [Metarhizium anisopliae]